MNKPSSSHCEQLAEQLPPVQPSLPIWQRESRWNGAGIILALCALVIMSFKVRADSLQQEGNSVATDTALLAQANALPQSVLRLSQ